MTIAPVPRDMPTPHDKRMEQKTARLISTIEQALDRGDATIVLSTGELVGAVGKGLEQPARRERVARGSSGWGR